MTLHSSQTVEKQAFCTALEDVARTVGEVWSVARRSSDAPTSAVQLLENGAHQTLQMQLNGNGSRTVAHTMKSLLLSLGFPKQNITLNHEGHGPEAAEGVDRSMLSLDLTHAPSITERTTAVRLLGDRLRHNEHDREVLAASIEHGHDIYRSNQPVYVSTTFYAPGRNIRALMPAMFVQAPIGRVAIEETPGECLKTAAPLRPFGKGTVHAVGVDEFMCLNVDTIALMRDTVLMGSLHKMAGGPTRY